MAPKDVHVPVLRTCKYVILCDKRDFADVTRLRTVRWEGCPGVSGWARCDHKDPYKEGAGGAESEVEMG